MLIGDTRKEFELPANGQYIGVLADIVDRGELPTRNGPRKKTDLFWLLFGLNTEGNIVPVLDSTGRQFRSVRRVNQSMNEASTFFGLVRDITGENPTIPYETENLIGRANLLLIKQEKNETGKVFANIKDISPLPAAVQPPRIPADFDRYKDKQKQQYGTKQTAQQVAPVVQFAPAVQAPVVSVAQAAPVVLDAPAKPVQAVQPVQPVSVDF